MESSWEEGSVHWFDSLSGEGMIKDRKGKSFFVHWSAIKTDAAFKDLKGGQEVMFKLISDTTFTQVSAVKEVIRTRG